MRKTFGCLVVCLIALVLAGCLRAPVVEGPVQPGKKEIGDSSQTADPTGETVVESPVYVSDFAPGVDPEGWYFGNRRGADHAADADKKPFDIEAYYSINRISSPRLSPDGKRILFTVTENDLPAGKSNTDIYLVGVDGVGLRRMTRDSGADYSPIWSPDGKSFAFISTRESGSQLWRMPVDGGEAHQLTSISTGVEDPVWSPDGKVIAFVSEVFPQFGADDEKNSSLKEDMKENPLQAHMADALLYRHWTAYADGTRRHVLALDLESKKIHDVTPGDYDSPVFAFGDGGFAFSPDGKEICFVSNRTSQDEQSWNTASDLWVVPLDGKAPRNITSANKAYDGHPLYSPDGKYIAFKRQAKPGYEADKFRLSLYERATGKVRVLTEEFQDTVLDFKWTSDSSKLVFKAPVKGRYPLFVLDVETAKVERLKHIPSVRSFHLGAGGELAFTYNTVSDPIELFSSDIKGKEARRITEFNRHVVAEYDVRPCEEIWVPGAGGKDVHVFIVKPHGFKPGKKYPLIINVHGGPQSQWSDSLRGDWQIYPGAGYVVAFFNPHGSVGYGADYTEAISADWGGKVYEDVMAVTEHMSNLEFVDSTKMGAMGWSYGGYMMSWLLGHTDKFKAIAAMMPIYDLVSFYGATEELWFPEWDVPGTPWENADAYAKWSPSNYAKNFKTPTLIVTGERDYRVPYTQSLQLFTALRRQGVPSRLIVYSNDGHWPSRVKSMPLYYAAHLDWFHKYLGGGPSPYDIEKMIQGRAFKKE